MLLFIELQIFKTEQIGSLSPLFKGEGFFWGGEGRCDGGGGRTPGSDLREERRSGWLSAVHAESVGIS